MGDLLGSMAEVEQANRVVNGVDNANLASVSSVGPIPTSVDEVVSGEDISKEEKETALKAKKEETSKPKEEAKPPEEGKKKEEEETEEKVPEAVQKKFDKLTRLRRTAERERDLEREKIAKLEKQIAELQAKVPAADRPKRADFTNQDGEFDEDAYMDAVADWKIEQKMKTSKAVEKKVEEDTTAKEDIEAAEDALNSMVEEGRTKFSDFDKVAMLPYEKGGPAISQAMFEAAMLTECPQDIFYYLGQNKEESEELHKMPVAKMAIAIGKLEAKLLKPAEKKEEKKEEVSTTSVAPAKKVTQAPEPIKPLKDTTSGVEKNPENMSASEYRKWREGARATA